MDIIGKLRNLKWQPMFSQKIIFPNLEVENERLRGEIELLQDEIKVLHEYYDEGTDRLRTVLEGAELKIERLATLLEQSEMTISDLKQLLDV